MEKKEYIERDAVLLAITGQPSELHYPSWYKGNIMEVPAADVVEVVHGDAEREYVESLLKRHAAYLLAKIDNTGTHVGKFEDITLDADGNWIIEADIESLSVTDCGDFMPVVRCKDCKHLETVVNIIGDMYCYCGNADGKYITEVDLDDFCSRGERKEE